MAPPRLLAPPGKSPLATRLDGGHRRGVNPWRRSWWVWRSKCISIGSIREMTPPRGASATPGAGRLPGPGGRDARMAKTGAVREAGQAACGACPTRRRQRRRPGLQSQVREDLLDNRRLQDRGDDLQLAAATRPVLEVDLGDAVEQPGQAHRLTCSRPAVHQCPVMAGTVCSPSSLIAAVGQPRR